MTEKDFEIQVFSLKDSLYGLSIKIMLDREIAADVVQEVFTKLWLKKDELYKVDNIKSYALKVTKNKCYDVLRKNKHSNVDIEALNEPTIDEKTERTVDMKIIATDLRKWVNTLPLAQREVIYLRDFEGLEFKEIMEITDMEYNAVKTNLSRARKKLKELLYMYYPETVEAL